MRSGRRPLSVRSRLIASSVIEFVVMAAIIATILVFTNISTRNEGYVQSALRRLTDSVTVAGAVSRQLESARSLSRSALPADSSYDDLRRATTSAFSRWKASLKQAGPQPRYLADFQKRNLEEAGALEKEYASIDGGLATALTAGVSGRAVGAEEKVATVQNLYEASFLPRIESTIELDRSAAAHADRESQSASHTSAVIPLVLAPVGLVIVALISLLLVRDIGTSLGKLEAATEQVGRGDLDVSVDIRRNNEFGELAESFNRMASELKRSTDELRLANQELDGYARTVSHDLKGPLSSMVIAQSLLREEADSLGTGETRASLVEILDVMEHSVKQALDLIDDLLSFAEAGQVPADVSEVDVSRVVQGVLEERSSQIAERGIRIVVDDELGEVEAASTHVYQLFANLIGNAIKYCDVARPVIRISYMGRDADGSLSYCVRDNGPGVPPGDLDRIFDPFFKGKGGGTGIGLATVDRIVKLYGGAVTASNEDGARFDFTMKGHSRESRE